MIIINSIGEIFEQIEVCLQEFWIFFFQFFFVLKIMENIVYWQGFFVVIRNSEFN